MAKTRARLSDASQRCSSCRSSKKLTCANCQRRLYPGDPRGVSGRYPQRILPVRARNVQHTNVTDRSVTPHNRTKRRSGLTNVPTFNVRLNAVAHHLLLSLPILRGPFSIELGVLGHPSKPESSRNALELVVSPTRRDIGDALCALLLRMTLGNEDFTSRSAPYSSCTAPEAGQHNPRADGALAYDGASSLWPPPDLRNHINWSIYSHADAHLLPPLTTGTLESGTLAQPVKTGSLPPSHPPYLPNTSLSFPRDQHWSIFVTPLEPSTEDGKHLVSDVTESELLADMLENMQVAKGVVT